MDRARLAFPELLDEHDTLLKLLESQDADGAESYWTEHLITAGATLLGPDGDAVVDLAD